MYERISNPVRLAQTALNLVRNPLDTFVELQSTRSSIVEFEVSNTANRVYLIFEPNLINKLQTQHTNNLEKTTRDMQILRTLSGDQMFTAPHSDSEWIWRRKGLQEAFHREKLNSYAPTIDDETENIAQRMISDKLHGTSKDLYFYTTILTARVAAKTLLGTDIRLEKETELVSQISGMLGYFSDCVRSGTLLWRLNWLPTNYNRQAKKMVRDLKNYCRSIASKRIQNPTEENDLLSLIVNRYSEHFSGEKLEEEAGHEVMDFLLAGHETTSNTLVWSLILLSQNPEFKDRIRKADDTEANNLCRAVFEEALRLYPPIWLTTRRASIDISLETQDGQNIVIKKGAYIAFPVYAIHHNTELWGVDANTFKPERFLNHERPEKGSFIPFGLGTRSCIGSGFAYLEGPRVLKTLVQKYDITTSNPHPQKYATLRPDKLVDFQIKTLS
ncbi:MAG: cytochrome P450 [Microgenomates group bacterium]